MELITYIENYTNFDLPPFKHPTKYINLSLQPNQQHNYDQFYSNNIGIPDKVFFGPSPSYNLLTENQESIQVYILFGYQLKLKDWENIRSLYPHLSIKVKLYKGNHVTQISQHTLNAKSFIKGQKQINQPYRTLIKKDDSKNSQSQVHIYTVQICSQMQPQCLKVIYYLPSIFDQRSKQLPLQCVKARYFNHKILQILNQYVSLDNNNISCFKDLAHHQFQDIVYSGKLRKFQVFIKLGENWSNKEVSQSFIQKLSQISMTDKHLLDEVDPLDFSQIKKQIRNLYLQQKRIRKSLTFEKLKIVQQIQNTLQFLNLKQVYPQKLTYATITPQMLKRIKNQNIDNKTSWIKQQYFIIKNLDARIIDLGHTKNKYRQIYMQQSRNNYQLIQEIRNQIKSLQTSIRYQQAQIINKTAQNKGTDKQQTTKLSSFNDNTKSKKHRTDTQGSKMSQNGKIRHQNKKSLPNQTVRQKKDIDQLQKQRILKFQMVKAEFQMQKQLIRRKAQYAKAAQQILSYLEDC